MNIFLVSMSQHQIKNLISLCIYPHLPTCTFMLSYSNKIQYYSQLQQQEKLIHWKRPEGTVCQPQLSFSRTSTFLCAQDFACHGSGVTCCRDTKLGNSFLLLQGSPTQEGAYQNRQAPIRRNKLLISRFSLHELRSFLVQSVNTTLHPGNFRHHLVKRKN